ncbi:MAG TPA: ribonucleoside-diphosphate reductase subunit alpha [Acidimicrobiales bacterium]|nr:ribonucleoside-diphosphate reductase subunit alpha [Acidimicrobiales bacterium]
MSTGDRNDNPAGMSVRKRDGSSEPVHVEKIVRAVARCADGLEVDVMRVATRTISGLHEGITTSELDQLSIATAAALTAEEPDYSRFAARLLAGYIEKEVMGQNIYSFSQSIKAGAANGIISETVADLVAANAYKLDLAVDNDRDRRFEYFGLRTVYDRYLIKDPESRLVTETPQYFFLRVACGLADTAKEAIAFYRLISSLEYMPSTPTLFNSGTNHSQMSSCYLLDSPADDLASIYERYADIAKLSKHAGGIGVSWSRIRSTGSHIQGTNGLSNGIVPWLKTLDSSVSAVNQGGKRKGAACVYLETWHADIEEFLELRDNTGDDMRRAHHLNFANWIPDEFMRRVESDETWSLFDPKVVPHLVDLYGDEFAAAYRAAEDAGLAARTLPARALYERMLRTLGETGNGWMTFKDASNVKANQTRSDRPDHVVHLSNLCTEIIEVTDADTHAVCNLGSINVGALVTDGSVDFARLREIVRTAVTYLDRVIDRNFYPTPEAESSNAKWRPIGLGQMGLQDVFFKLGLPFDSPEALALSTRIAEEIYFAAVERSVELADELGAHASFADSKAAQGTFQFELWGVEPTDPARWEDLRARMVASGLRNSLLLAIAPTATIASIAGCYECIEPQLSNLFKRETLSGEFLQVNRYLADDLKRLGLWTEEIRDAIKRSEGSILDVAAIPEEVRRTYRTAWELSMRSLIDLAAARGAYIDQSQSLNLFSESPTINSLSAMYFHAWKSGLKTTYYLRSRPRTRINQTTVSAAGTAPSAAAAPTTKTLEQLVCSLENPESCEVCT